MDQIDVAIIGAGISGIGVAAHLRRALPDLTVRLIEARDGIGGTWALFRYPGLRSDSDLHTLGYGFRPWTSENAIAPVAEIMDYLRGTVADEGLAPLITFGTRATRAEWDAGAQVWRVALQGLSGATTLTARWLVCATGYFDHAQGFTPELPGLEGFAGRVIHPQHWPEDFDPRGRTIAVLGSGATAVTLLPALAEAGAEVVQVQRTPSYLLPVPRRDAVARVLGRWLPARTAHRLVRGKNILQQRVLWGASRRFPRLVKGVIGWLNRRALPASVPLDPHFTPPYDPWDQRLCTVPDGDFFAALRSGRARIVTGAVAEVTPSGLRLADGREVACDTLVTATGLAVKLLGGMTLHLPEGEVDPAQRVAFKGSMLSGVPNLTFTIGYTNASWTLKIEPVAQHLARLLAHMRARGWAVATPRLPDAPMPTRPLFDFAAGYVQRAAGVMPRQGDRGPWVMHDSVFDDRRLLLRAPVDDPALVFEAAR